MEQLKKIVQENNVRQQQEANRQNMGNYESNQARNNNNNGDNRSQDTSASYQQDDGDIENGQNQQNPEEDNQAEKKLEIPRFLQKFSGTFFKKLDPKINPAELIKKKEEEKKRKKEEFLKIKQEQEEKKKKQKMEEQIKLSQQQKNKQYNQNKNNKRIMKIGHTRSISSINFSKPNSLAINDALLQKNLKQVKKNIETDNNNKYKHSQKNSDITQSDYSSSIKKGKNKKQAKTKTKVILKKELNQNNKMVLDQENNRIIHFSSDLDEEYRIDSYSQKNIALEEETKCQINTQNQEENYNIQLDTNPIYTYETERGFINDQTQEGGESTKSKRKQFNIVPFKINTKKDDQNNNQKSNVINGSNQLQQSKKKISIIDMQNIDIQQYKDQQEEYDLGFTPKNTDKQDRQKLSEQKSQQFYDTEDQNSHYDQFNFYCNEDNTDNINIISDIINFDDIQNEQVQQESQNQCSPHKKKNTQQHISIIDNPIQDSNEKPSDQIQSNDNQISSMSQYKNEKAEQLKTILEEQSVMNIQNRNFRTISQIELEKEKRNQKILYQIYNEEPDLNENRLTQTNHKQWMSVQINPNTVKAIDLEDSQIIIQDFSIAQKNSQHIVSQQKTTKLNESNYRGSVLNPNISYQQSQMGPEQSFMSNSMVNKSAVCCLVCFDKPPDAVFMECGHGGICYDCSLELWKATGECYLCRNEITHVLQVDLNKRQGNFIKVLSSTQMVRQEQEEDSDEVEEQDEENEEDQEEEDANDQNDGFDNTNNNDQNQNTNQVQEIEGTEQIQIENQNTRNNN